jgi:hypothetical protein
MCTKLTFTQYTYLKTKRPPLSARGFTKPTGMSAASVLLDSPALESLRTMPGAGSSANKSEQLHSQVRDAFLGIGNMQVLSTMQEGEDGKNLENLTAKLAQVHKLYSSQGRERAQTMGFFEMERGRGYTSGRTTPIL